MTSWLGYERCAARFLIILTLLIIFSVSSALASPGINLAPIPKYAKRVENLPPGLYVVIYPRGDEGPVTVPRKKTDGKST